MLSSSSIQAIAASLVKPASISGPTPSLGPPVTEAARATRAAATSAQAAQKALQVLPPGLPPSRPAPRGSLLDLSV